MNLDTALAALADDPTAPLDLAELALRLAADEYPTWTWTPTSANWPAWPTRSSRTCAARWKRA